MNKEHNASGPKNKRGADLKKKNKENGALKKRRRYQL